MIALADVADALVTELTTLSATLDVGSQFTPERAYLHEMSLKATPTFRASVAVGSKATDSASRGLTHYTMEFQVTFSQRVAFTGVPAADNAVIDALLEAVETVQLFFDDGHLIANTPGGDARAMACRFEGGGIGGVIDEGRLDEESFFWSLLVVSVEAWDADAGIELVGGGRLLLV